MFPETIEVEGNISTRGKTKLFPEGPYIKCFAIYLDFPLNNHIAKKKTTAATTEQLYPGRNIRSGTRD